MEALLSSQCVINMLTWTATPKTINPLRSFFFRLNSPPPNGYIFIFRLKMSLRSITYVTAYFIKLIYGLQNWLKTPLNHVNVLEIEFTGLLQSVLFKLASVWAHAPCDAVSHQTQQLVYSHRFCKGCLIYCSGFATTWLSGACGSSGSGAFCRD